MLQYDNEHDGILKSMKRNYIIHVLNKQHKKISLEENFTTTLEKLMDKLLHIPEGITVFEQQIQFIT